MGAFQLPGSVLGDAAGCLIYSFVCLIANCILVWLIWIHRERTGYVAFIAYFTLLATVSSLVQQLYDYILWRDIMTWQFHYGKAHETDAEVQYQNEIFGLKLALAYLRAFAFMVEVSLVFFFSLSLAASVYGWWAKNPRVLRTMSITGRVVPVVLAVISIILLQLDFTHKSFTVYAIVANAQFVISLVGSCIFLLMILIKYLQSRWQLKTWRSLQYGQGAQSTSTTRKSTIHSRRSRALSDSTRSGSATFDRWLVVRLSIAFATLCVFEWTNISPHLSAKDRVVEAANETAPDLSVARAMKTVTGYLSGVSPSLLAFIVFGTTKTFQRKMYQTFVPVWLRRKTGRNGNGDFANHHPSQLPFSTKNSSTVRTSTFVPTAPSTPQRPRSLSTQLSHSSVRKPEPSLGPIYEPGCLWLPDDDTPRSSLRYSQIGVAVSASRRSARETFLLPETDNESVKDMTSIPMSRFNSHHTRHLSGSSSTTTRIWSEGRRASVSSSRYGDSRPRQAADGGSRRGSMY